MSENGGFPASLIMEMKAPTTNPATPPPSLSLSSHSLSGIGKDFSLLGRCLERERERVKRKEMRQRGRLEKRVVLCVEWNRKGMNV